MTSSDRLVAGFGLGALNDADEDDLDIYDSGTNRSHSKTAYELGNDGHGDNIMIGSKADKGKQPASFVSPASCVSPLN